MTIGIRTSYRETLEAGEVLPHHHLGESDGGAGGGGARMGGCLRDLVRGWPVARTGT